MSAGDDPAGAVSERTRREPWPLFQCPACGACATYPPSPAGPSKPHCGRHSATVPMNMVVSADWRAAALELADATQTYLDAGDYRTTDGTWTRLKSALARVRSLDEEGHGG